MESVILLMRQAEQAGLSVWFRRNRLHVRGPRRAEPLALELLSRKAEVLDALIVQHINDLDAEALHEFWTERVGIREYDGHLPRQQAEALALVDVFQALLRRLGIGEGTP
jgi:hypothetical protein